MKTSDAGIALIKQFEAFEPNIYRDVVGLETIGYGHLVKRGESFGTLTEAEACDLLADDLLRFELAVSSVEASLSQSEFDACVSLAFNIGVGGFTKSTVAKRLAADDYAGAADAFLLWNKAGGKVIKGLVNRREKEMAIFLS